MHVTRVKWQQTGRFSFYALLVLSLGLPLVLAVHTILTGRELKEMRAIYLRDRAANIAARLETMPPDQLRQERFNELFESEPALVAIRIIRSDASDGGDPALLAVRSGRELYHIEELTSGGNRMFRAYIPFHSGGFVYIAGVDLSANAPDFILLHAQHSARIALLTGSVLILLSFFALWSVRRTSRLERRQLETERLAELGALSAVLAHEIRNPLGTIKGFAQLARESAPAAQRKPLDAIVTESRRLESLVSALLLYGRPANPAFGMAEWQSLADDLTVYARELIGGRPIRFSIDSDLPRLFTDANMLKQALLNLIRNSVEAIPPGDEGNIRLRVTKAPGGMVLISVEDDGPGIPESVRPKLFSPFVTGKASGTGLGLSISKKLVEALGGRLELLQLDPHGTRAEMQFHGTNSDR